MSPAARATTRATTRAATRAAALAALLLPAATGAGAESLRLRSGEHGDFTRLVLPLAEPSGWRLGRMDGGYGLRLARPGISVDLSRAFDLIPRNRVQALAWDGESRTLRIASDCDCRAIGFVVGEATLVVDIADGPAPEGDPFALALDPPPEARPETRPGASTGSPGPAPAEGAMPPLLSDEMRSRYDRQIALPGLSPDERITPPRPAAERSPHHPPHRPPPGGEDPFAQAESRRRIAEIEAELLKQLARAGSQGMIEPNPEFGGTAGGPGGETAQPDAATPPSRHPGENVEAVTGVDRAAPDAPAAPEDGRRACLPPARFAFLSEEPPEEPHALISAARQRLMREFDAPDTEAAEALARAYLHLGFGAEARQVATEFLATAETGPLYLALALAMDGPAEGGPPPATTALTGQFGCPGAASFWALVIQPVPETIGEESFRAVVATASGLPLHLRRWLVPRLARKVLARGHAALAAALRDTLMRAEGAHGSGYTMLQAALAETGDIAAGGTGAPSPASLRAAEGLLTRVAETNEAEAPGALAGLIRLQTARGEVPAPARLELAEAAVFEHRGTPLARDLHAALAPAYAIAGDWPRAFAHLDAAAALPAAAWPATPLPPGTADPLPAARSDVALRLAGEASDEGFLRVMFSPARAGLGAQVSDAAAHALAARLLALGFPGQALAQSAHLPPEPAYRLTRVRALKAQGRYQRALASLAGLQGPEPDALRAELLAALGENGPAHVLGRIAGDEELARRAAWASGDPEAIRESGSKSEAGFAETVAAGAPPAPPPRPSLGATQALLEQSRRRRGAIEALLEEKSGTTAATLPAPEDMSGGAGGETSGETGGETGGETAPGT